MTNLDLVPVPRVLHVAQPGDGGVAGYLVRACLDQAERGWDIAVACPPDTWLAAELARHDIAHLPWRARRNPGAASVGETGRLARLIERHSPQVVHLHAAKAGLAGRLAVRGRIPTLHQPHGWSWLAVTGVLRETALRWERLAARWTDRFVCVAEDEARHGREMGVRGRYAVVRNGVDLSRFRPAGSAERRAARAELGLATDHAVVVCVGRVTRQKGQDTLVAAWRGVASQRPDARLVVIGDGDLLPSVRANAPAGVRFAGAVPDVRGWLAAADLVVLPSRWEGLPLTALEALATGRPIVGSAIPGLTEVVAAPVGELVRPDDPDALAGALLRWLRDPALLATASAVAVRHAAGFDLCRTLEQLAELTRDATTRGRVHR